MGKACLEGEVQGFGVHEGEHQDFAGRFIRHDCRNKPIGIELWREGLAFFKFLLIGRIGEEMGVLRHSWCLVRGHIGCSGWRHHARERAIGWANSHWWFVSSDELAYISVSGVRAGPGMQV